MKRKLIALTMILALALSLSTLAMAATTDGSIQYKEGGVIIIPPPDCCHCYGDEPCEDKDCDEKPPCKPGDDGKCGCECHDEFDPPKGHFEFGVAKNLFFGEHLLGASGDYDSTVYGDPTHDQNPDNVEGRTTGVQITNQMAVPYDILVSVSEFEWETQSGNLNGARLELVGAGNWANNGTELSTQNGADLTPNTATKVITVPSGLSVIAAWSGILDVLPGTAIHTEKAQATLTWTSQVAP